MEKEFEYADKIFEHLLLIFDKDKSGVNFIDNRDFKNGDNKVAFFHALGNIAPTAMYKTLTGQSDIDMLGFNHIANCLICDAYKKGDAPAIQFLPDPKA